MGELRAYLLPVRSLRALLGAGPAGRAHVVELAAPALAPSRPPAPLGPIYTRVPGAHVVRNDDPTPDDLDHLLGQGPVPRHRARATWRVVEAVVAGSAAANTRTAADRPVGLAPLGLAVPEPDDLVVGSWTLAQAAALPALAAWVEDAVAVIPAGQEGPDVLVFWEAGRAG